MQEDRLAELASDNARRERLEAAAAQIERERDSECTFQPVLNSATPRLPDQENQNPFTEVTSQQYLPAVDHPGEGQPVFTTVRRKVSHKGRSHKLETGLMACNASDCRIFKKTSKRHVCDLTSISGEVCAPGWPLLPWSVAPAVLRARIDAGTGPCYHPGPWAAVLTGKHCVSAGTLFQCAGRALM